MKLAVFHDRYINRSKVHNSYFPYIALNVQRSLIASSLLIQGSCSHHDRRQRGNRYQMDWYIMHIVQQVLLSRDIKSILRVVIQVPKALLDRMLGGPEDA